MRYRDLRSALSASVAVCAVALASPAWAQTRSFDVPAQAAATGIPEFARQADIQILVSEGATRGRTTRQVRGRMPVDRALQRLIQGTGLSVASSDGRTYTLSAASPAPGEGQAVGAAAENEGANQEIVVTGTNIRGVEPVASPLLRFDRRDIERSGYDSTADFIQRGLPQNFGAGASEDLIAAGVRGRAELNQGRGSGVNLRGLGTGSTLVLLNGRRMAPAGFGSFVDISTIPLAAIERIDVLTDGASATYGSDAIAGVVNFVLRDDFEGAETRVAYGALSNSSVDIFQVGQTLGTAWGTGHVLAVYDYASRDALNTRDRANSRDALETTYLLPRQRTHSLLLSGSQNLTENVELFADALYSRRSALQQIRLPSILRQDRANTLNEQINLVAGARVELSSNWRLEVSGTYSSNDLRADYSYPGSDEPAVRENSDFRSWFADGQISGALFDLPGGALRLAFGGQYRTELLRTSDEGADPRPPRRYQRNVSAAFAELYAPLVSDLNAMPGIRRLDLTGAVRYERYSDFGHSVDPKVGIAWSPFEGLKLRATWGTSFRAPRLQELDDSDIQVALVNFNDSTVPGGRSFGAILLGNNPDLGPERATTWTAGADFNFDNPDIQVNLTYFNVDFDDRISRPNAGSIAGGDLANPAISPFIISRTPDIAYILNAIARVRARGSQPLDLSGGRDPATATVLVDARSQNLARTTIDGIDLRIAYQTESSIGRWSLEANGSYFLNYEERAAPTSPDVSVVDTVYRPARFRARGSLGWANRGWEAGLFVNYVDGYRDDRPSENRDIPAWTTFDARVAVDLGGLFSERSAGRTQLSLSALNLFNKRPPFVADLLDFNINYDPENHDINGRSLTLTLRHRW